MNKLSQVLCQRLDLTVKFFDPRSIQCKVATMHVVHQVLHRSVRTVALHGADIRIDLQHREQGEVVPLVGGPAIGRGEDHLRSDARESRPQ